MYSRKKKASAALEADQLDKSQNNNSTDKVMDDNFEGGGQIGEEKKHQTPQKIKETTPSKLSEGLFNEIKESTPK